MGDTSIGLLDDCLTSLHTKQLQQRNKWRDAASRGGGQRRPAADEYSPPRKDLLRRPAGESLSPKPAPPAGAPPPKTVGRDTPSPVLAARAARRAATGTRSTTTNRSRPSRAPGSAG